MKSLPLLIAYSVLISSCTNIYVDCEAPLQYDYNGITVPPNIAPIHFALADSVDSEIHSVSYTVNGKKGKWKKILEKAKGSSIEVEIEAKKGFKKIHYKPFPIYISNDSIDSYLAYRLIEPGYELWNEMGIYQRNLENFSQTPIIKNTMTDNGCVNCHSFASHNPEKFLFHARSSCAGTYIIQDKSIEKLNTKTPETISALVYPQWHPSGRFVVFSVNQTNQMYHISNDNRIEVYDSRSDVVVYDLEKHEVFSCPQLKSYERFETFPTFSPSGDIIYFCFADSIKIPDNYNKIRYSLCSIDFNAENRSFGDEVTILYDASDDNAGSISFPRVSPDGKYLMFTKSGYGNFSIWHKDADLYLLDLATGKQRCLDEINSSDVESYHSWSSNSKWVVFSSRREDKLYTKLYFSHVDENGVFSKPFILPQKNPRFYNDFMKSFNIPEFITGPVNTRPYNISSVAKKSQGTDITFSSK